MKRKKKKKNTFFLCAAVIFMCAVVFCAVKVQNYLQPEIENAGLAEHGVEKIKEISYNGETGKIRRQLDTVLFIGIDGEELPRYKEGEMIPYYNFQQADFLMLMVFDNIQKTVQLVQINRDTMTFVPWLGVTGDVGGYNYEQITLSHNSGSGLKDSCINTVNTVSKLLFSLPIDHYVKISMGAVPVLNDIVGGVPVTMPYDLTELEPEYKAGATVTLLGRKALSFVRARQGVADGTNISRMGRQRLYIDSYLNRASIMFSQNPELAFDTVNQLGYYMLSDMTVEQLASLADHIYNYEMKEIYTPEGRNMHDDRFYEFFPYYDKMWEKMKEIVC